MMITATVPKRAAKRQGANVAHKYFRGMRVVPQETERGADERAAKYGEFAHARDVLNFKVIGPAEIAADVGEDGERTRRNYRAANRQARPDHP